MEHHKERDRKSTFTGTGSPLTVNDEKLKDPTNVANPVALQPYRALADRAAAAGQRS